MDRNERLGVSEKEMVIESLRWKSRQYNIPPERMLEKRRHPVMSFHLT